MSPESTAHRLFYRLDGEHICFAPSFGISHLIKKKECSSALLVLLFSSRSVSSIESKDIYIVSEIVRNSSVVVQIYFGSKTITTDLSSALGRCSNLERFTLDRCTLDAVLMDALIVGLSRCPKLVSVRLSGVRFKEMPNFRNLATLESLEMVNATTTSPRLVGLETLRTLNLSDNPLGDAGAGIVLKTLPHLECLHLTNCNIRHCRRQGDASQLRKMPKTSKAPSEHQLHLR